MATLDQWYDELVTEVPGVTEGGAKQALRRVFRVFCQDSAAYVLEHEAPIDIVADQPTYDVMDAYPSLVLSDDHLPVYIQALGYFNDYANDSQRWRFLQPLQSPQYRITSRAPSHQPWGYKTTINNLGVFELTPVVDRNITSAIGTFVAFRFKDYPNFPDTTIPEVFMSYWFDIIRDGAIGDLCAQQDKPYTNPVKAQLHQQRFRNGIARARDEARNQFNMSQNEFVFPVTGGWISRGHTY